MEDKYLVVIVAVRRANKRTSWGGVHVPYGPKSEGVHKNQNQIHHKDLYPFVEKTLFNHLFRCSKVQVICETQSLGFGG